MHPVLHPRLRSWRRWQVSQQQAAPRLISRARPRPHPTTCRAHATLDPPATEVPMVVTRHNFGQMMPVVQQAVQACAFFSIDCEFTGLASSNNTKAFYHDDYQQRYEKVAASAELFLVPQLGLSTFIAHEGGYQACTFNFYLFPQPCRGYDRRFLSQASSLTFLIEHGFDFNKMIRDGIPYVPLSAVSRVAASGLASSSGSEDEAAAAEVEEDFGDDGAGAYGSPDDASSGQGAWGGDAVGGGVTPSSSSSSSMNFAQLFQLLRGSGRPCVVHNGLYDLAYCMASFIGPLPASLQDFKALVTTWFPSGLYDTKHLATNLTANLFISTSLADLYTGLCVEGSHSPHTDSTSSSTNVSSGAAASAGPKPATASLSVAVANFLRQRAADKSAPLPTLPHVSHAPGYNAYLGSSSSTPGSSHGPAHEAGYDAFMTGAVFSKLLALYAAARQATLSPAGSVTAAAAAAATVTGASAAVRTADVTPSSAGGDAGVITDAATAARLAAAAAHNYHLPWSRSDLDALPLNQPDPAITSRNNVFVVSVYRKPPQQQQQQKSSKTASPNSNVPSSPPPSPSSLPSSSAATEGSTSSSNAAQPPSIPASSSVDISTISTRALLDQIKQRFRAAGYESIRVRFPPGDNPRRLAFVTVFGKWDQIRQVPSSFLRHGKDLSIKRWATYAGYDSSSRSSSPGGAAAGSKSGPKVANASNAQVGGSSGGGGGRKDGNAAAASTKQQQRPQGELVAAGSPASGAVASRRTASNGDGSDSGGRSATTLASTSQAASSASSSSSPTQNVGSVSSDGTVHSAAVGGENGFAAATPPSKDCLDISFHSTTAGEQPVAPAPQPSPLPPPPAPAVTAAPKLTRPVWPPTA